MYIESRWINAVEWICLSRVKCVLPPHLIIFISEASFIILLKGHQWYCSDQCVSAHTCYSCRAFFRRTSLRVKLKGLKRCKTGRRDCPQTEEARSCIHCRYQKCLAVGMQSDLVMGKREKNVSVNAETEEEDILMPPLQLSST